MQAAVDDANGCFQLFVRHGQSITIDGMRRSNDVAHLVHALESKVSVPYSAARLDYGGKPLQEGRNLAYYGLGAGATVQLALRGRGGGCGASKTADSGGSAMSPAADGMPPSSVEPSRLAPVQQDNAPVKESAEQAKEAAQAKAVADARAADARAVDARTVEAKSAEVNAAEEAKVAAPRVCQAACQIETLLLSLIVFFARAGARSLALQRQHHRVASSPQRQTRPL